MKPTNPIVAAVAAIEAGDYEEAEWLLMQIGDEDPESYQTALFYRSRIQCNRGDHADSQALLRRAIGVEASGYLYYYLGACEQHEEKWGQSERSFLRAIELDPRLTDAYILLGLALRKQGRNDEALTAFEYALVNDPRAKLARYYLAELCIEIRDYKRALAQLHVLQQLEPEYAPTHRLQAEIHLKHGDRRQALVELCWLAERGYGDAFVFTNMGYSFEAIGEKVQALVAFEHALRHDPELPGVMAAAAKINEELERYASALAFYRALEREVEWAERARNAIDRLERKIAFCRLTGKPEDADISFAGFVPPRVAEPSAIPSPLSLQRGQPRTMPLGRTPTSPVHSATRGERQPNPGNFLRARQAESEAAAEYAWAAAQSNAAAASADRGNSAEPLALRLARNVAALTREVAADPTSILSRVPTAAMPAIEEMKHRAAQEFNTRKEDILGAARGFLGKLRGKTS